MIYHENCPPADNSHEISCLIFFLKKRRQNLKLSSAANYRWRFKGLTPTAIEAHLQCQVSQNV